MKVIGIAMMYCGMRNPERELTEEEYDKVKTLCAQLSDVGTGPVGYMGFSGYGVFNQVDWYVTTDFYGKVGLWSEQDKEIKYYKDTVGLCAYLHLILGPMVQEHSDPKNWKSYALSDIIDTK